MYFLFVSISVRDPSLFMTGVGAIAHQMIKLKTESICQPLSINYLIALKIRGRGGGGGGGVRLQHIYSPVKVEYEHEELAESDE